MGNFVPYLRDTFRDHIKLFRQYKSTVHRFFQTQLGPIALGGMKTGFEMSVDVNMNWQWKWNNDRLTVSEVNDTIPDIDRQGC